MLPPLNVNGDLPAGIHLAAWTEIEHRFGQGTAERVRTMSTLRHLHELAARTGALQSFFIFGSFVSAVPAPRDADVILIMHRDFRIEDCPRESLTLFSHADAQARYGASVFWLREGMLGEAAMREFFRVWQTKRDGSLRGILELA
jgi:hypothetical protein